MIVCSVLNCVQKKSTVEVFGEGKVSVGGTGHSFGFLSELWSIVKEFNEKSIISNTNQILVLNISKSNT